MTSALAFMKKHHNDPQRIHWDQRGDIVQSVVLFPSFDVADGATPAEKFLDNDYGFRNRRNGRGAASRRANVTNVIAEVRQFVEEEIILPKGGILYSWPVDVGDYESCFEAVAKATLALGEPDSTGKHLWANLTGGTNIINAALMEVTALSGLIARLYYTFIAKQSDCCYLRPPSEDASQFDWKEVNPPKTALDQAYYAALEVLEDISSWCTDDELLARLKRHPEQGSYFDKVSLERLRREFLNRMHGYEIQRRGQDRYENQIAEWGRKALRDLHSPLYQSLTLRGQPLDQDLIEQYKKELRDEEVWKADY